MDPAQQPATPEIPDFSRRTREANKRQDQRRNAPHADGNPPKDRFHDAELRKAIERYRDLFNTAPDAYLITDMRGTISEANLAAGRLFGVDPRLLTGKPLPSFFDEAGRRGYRKQLDRICDLDRLDDWEILIQPRKGDPIPVSVTIARTTHADSAAGGCRWVIRDITKRRRAEDALRELNRELESRVASRTAQLAAANRVKDELLLSERQAREHAEAADRVKAEFLTLLSHEFRTPLQAIFGYTELLDRQIHGPLNQAQLRDLHRIQQSQHHMLGLITTILDFARLDSGQEIEVNLCPTVVHDILVEMEGFIGSQLEKRKLQYQYHCGDAGAVANADPAKLQQIVLNLLGNALKFTPAGGRVALECDRERESVVIRVVDSGIGIPREKLETVFEPFVQIRRQDIRAEGTGLGLPISRRLSTAMGATLTASSNPEQGSTFTLRLPVITA